MVARVVSLQGGAALASLACLLAVLLLTWQSGEGASTLLDWWEPTLSRGPSSGVAGAAGAGRGREPLVLKARAQGAGAQLSSAGAAPSASLRAGGGGGAGGAGAAGRETQLDEEDDSLSEAELASRLGRAIDRHEKCRRHWPHLQRLEGAQEIRVNDARNNLEVANRGMERARKELVDAENLVMAARTEHLEYEAQRRKFHDFRERYNRRLAIVDSRKDDAKLYQEREDQEEAKIKQNRATLAALREQARHLSLQQKTLVELKERDSARLEQMSQVELAEKRGINMATGQKLAQVASEGEQAAQPKAGAKEAKPVLSQESDGIVYPSDVSDESASSSAQQHVSLQAEIARLRARSSELSQEEVAAFATLPQDEKRIRELRGDIREYRKKKGIEATETLVAREQLAHDESKMASAKAIKLDKDKLQLAHLNELVDLARESKARHEVAALRQKEAQGPNLSRALSMKREKLAALEALVHKQQSLAAAGAVSQDESNRSGGKAQTQELSQEPEKAKKPSPPLSRAQLEADLKKKSEQLNAIKQTLLKVKSKIRPSKERVAVDHEMLKSRSHELSRATKLVHAVEGKATQKLFSVYNERLKALHDERRKADALLAKAERMLNIARLDTEHATRTKKAALEELTYATAKLRKYQDLRARSQHCQMDSWSTIRRLTHRARERKMLETADLRKEEALRARHDKVREQELSEVG